MCQTLCQVPQVQNCVEYRFCHKGAYSLVVAMGMQMAKISGA